MQSPEFASKSEWTYLNISVVSFQSFFILGSQIQLASALFCWGLAWQISTNLVAKTTEIYFLRVWDVKTLRYGCDSISAFIFEWCSALCAFLYKLLLIRAPTIVAEGPTLLQCHFISTNYLCNKLYPKRSYSYMLRNKMGLETTMLSEINQAQKVNIVKFLPMRNPEYK